MSEQHEGWICQGHGPNLPAELGNLCFHSAAGHCVDQAQCHARMAGTRRQMFRRINELAAAGDPDFEYLAEEFKTPDQILNADDDSFGATKPASHRRAVTWVRGNAHYPLFFSSVMIDQSEFDRHRIDLRAEGFAQVFAPDVRALSKVVSPTGNFVTRITSPNDIELIRISDYHPGHREQRRLLAGSLPTAHDTFWLDHCAEHGLLVIVAPDLAALGDAPNMDALAPCWVAPAQLVRQQ